ncbi:MAG: hypothetical protein H7235_04375, partial [Bdellovibrionaceae bacterium]|nr:hypothetical protein [Pseudobdellovibrionaceae bacterium]
MNLFVPKRTSYEDQVSAGFCYLLNICDKSLGNLFLDKMSELSGVERSILGDFVNCDFIGSKYISEKAISKPDIEIVTSTTSIYIENKIEASADSIQLAKHLKSIPRKSYLMLLTKYVYKIDQAVLNTNSYIKPTSSDHFRWIDFDLAFSESATTNFVEKKLLSDFKATLHSEGIKGRSYNCGVFSQVG